MWAVLVLVTLVNGSVKASHKIVCHVSIFYHKLINRQLPKYFECFVYQTNIDLHNYNTRRGHRLHIPRINHAFAQLNIRHSVIQTVNNMSDNVIDKIRTHNLKVY